MNLGSKNVIILGSTIAIIAFLSSINPVHAIGFDNKNYCLDDSVRSCNIIIGSGTDRLLVAQVSYGRVNSLSVSDVAIGGSHFTKLGTVNNTGIGVGRIYTDIWYLKAPTSGSQTVSFTYSGSPAYSSIGLFSFTGVNQTTPINAASLVLTNGILPTSSNLNLQITPTTPDAWIVGAAISSFNGLLTPVFASSVYDGLSDFGNAFRMAAQYSGSVVLGSPNTLSWGTGGTANQPYAAILFEIRSDDFVATVYKHDATTPLYGYVIQTNASSSNNVFPLISGVADLPRLSGNQNFSAKDAITSMIVKKQLNYDATSQHSITMVTNDFIIDCPSVTTGHAVELWTNETDGHHVTLFTNPTCYSNNTLKWHVFFSKNGISPLSYSTQVFAKILNITLLSNAFLKANTTMVSTAFTTPYVVSANIPVGTGLQNIGIYFSLNLTKNSVLPPQNYTAGGLVGNQTNTVLTPIIFTRTDTNSSYSNLAINYPQPFTLNCNLNYQNEQISHQYIGLTKASTTNGRSTSNLVFLNPNNDVVTAQCYDQATKVNGTYVMTTSISGIPLVTMIKNFQNGTYGTHGMIGSIDLITLSVIIISMIGLNRTNESLGIVITVMAIGALAYFQLIAFPIVLIPAILLVMLITFGSTKKLPWS